MAIPARTELLVDPAWVWEHREDPAIRIVDCTTSEVYERAHIPGAVQLPRHPFLKTEPDPFSHLNEPLHVIEPADFATAMGGIGVSNDTTVVAYDSVGNHWATRLWWVLLYYGHKNARVLNGGTRQWLAEQRPLTDAEPQIAAGTFVPNVDETRIVRVDELLARYGDPDVQVVNVLPPDFYLGRSDPFGNRRRGHIPGSLNVPFNQLLTDDEPRRLKSAEALDEVARGAGLRPDRETIVHCQGGIATTLGVFALSVLGWDRVRCYDAAMGEWANRDDTPLVLEEPVPSG